jgi:hypothetical protein
MIERLIEAPQKLKIPPEVSIAAQPVRLLSERLAAVAAERVQKCSY